MDRGKLQVARPNVCRVGGLGEAKAVCEMAAERGLIIVPHRWKTGISISATPHLAFTQPHCAFIEYLPPALCFETLRKELAAEDLQLVNGEIPLATKPGLGFELNRDALQRYTVA
jgi:L-alanine-DL-glutamate epimerase-like enolase superfamily enzyme